jgi:hypothetical protein
VIPVVAIAFVLLGGLLLWFVIGGRGAWWLKLGAIVVTCGFTFAVWNALDSFSGWPTDQRPPARALLVSSTVDEPKAIYVWLVAPARSDVFGYRPDKAAPRAYRLPYSRELHEQVTRGAALAKKGRPVELMHQPHGTGGRATSFVVRAFRPPPVSLPRKQTPSAMPVP